MAEEKPEMPETTPEPEITSQLSQILELTKDFREEQQKLSKRIDGLELRLMRNEAIAQKKDDGPGTTAERSTTKQKLGAEEVPTAEKGTNKQEQSIEQKSTSTIDKSITDKIYGIAHMIGAHPGNHSDHEKWVGSLERALKVHSVHADREEERAINSRILIGVFETTLKTGTAYDKYQKAVVEHDADGWKVMDDVLKAYDSQSVFKTARKLKTAIRNVKYSGYADKQSGLDEFCTKLNSHFDKLAKLKGPAGQSFEISEDQKVDILIEKFIDYHADWADSIDTIQTTYDETNQQMTTTKLIENIRPKADRLRMKNAAAGALHQQTGDNPSAGRQPKSSFKCMNCKSNDHWGATCKVENPKYVCKFNSSKNGCNRGNKCRFAHVPGSEAAAILSQLGGGTKLDTAQGALNLMKQIAHDHDIARLPEEDDIRTVYGQLKEMVGRAMSAQGEGGPSHPPEERTDPWLEVMNGAGLSGAI